MNKLNNILNRVGKQIRRMMSCNCFHLTCTNDEIDKAIWKTEKDMLG